MVNDFFIVNSYTYYLIVADHSIIEKEQNRFLKLIFSHLVIDTQKILCSNKQPSLFVQFSISCIKWRFSLFNNSAG